MEGEGRRKDKASPGQSDWSDPTGHGSEQDLSDQTQPHCHKECDPGKVVEISTGGE